MLLLEASSLQSIHRNGHEDYLKFILTIEFLLRLVRIFRNWNIIRFSYGLLSLTSTRCLPATFNTWLCSSHGELYNGIGHGRLESIKPIIVICFLSILSITNTLNFLHISLSICSLYGAFVDRNVNFDFTLSKILPTSKI